MNTRKFLSPADVAALLGVERRSVNKLSRAGQIPPCIQGHVSRIRLLRLDHLYFELRFDLLRERNRLATRIFYQEGK